MKTKEGPSNLFPNQNRPSIFTFSKIPYARDSLKKTTKLQLLFFKVSLFSDMLSVCIEAYETSAAFILSYSERVCQNGIDSDFYQFFFF